MRKKKEEQNKHKQYKEEKLRRQKLIGRWKNLMTQETRDEMDDGAIWEEQKAAPKCAMKGRKMAAQTWENEDC